MISILLIKSSLSREINRVFIDSRHTIRLQFDDQVDLNYFLMCAQDAKCFLFQVQSVLNDSSELADETRRDSKANITIPETPDASEEYVLSIFLVVLYKLIVLNNNQLPT